MSAPRRSSSLTGAEFRRLARAVLAVTATYVAFLLSAQFGFLEQVERAAAGDLGEIHRVLAAMGAAGLFSGFVAAHFARRMEASRALRWGLLATSASTALSALARQEVALELAAVAIGASLGWLTVTLAGSLRQLAPRGAWGRAAGWGTGIAYFVSNLPPLFSAQPAVRAVAGSVLCLFAAAVPPLAEEAAVAEEREDWPRWRLGASLVAFAALILVDSAFFAHVQRTPELLARAWGGGLSLRQGVVHLVAAVVAGIAVDRGVLGGLLLLCGATFGLALPAIAEGGAASPLYGALGSLGAMGAMAYAAGVAIYSAALVAAPASATERRHRALRYAAVLYGVAGWLGSALGVGAAEHQALRTAGVIGLAAFAAAGLLAAVGRFGVRAWLGPALTAVAAIALAFGIDAAFGPAAAANSGNDRVAQGREVYLSEGCQYCHSQYVRRGTHDDVWWGPVRALDRGERPPTPGNRRIGPDLSNVGLRRSATWNEIHLRDPRAVVPGSRMPSFAHLFGDERGAALVSYLASLGAGSGGERGRWIAKSTTSGSPGSPERGAALFHRHCTSCHGEDGAGGGAAASRFARPAMDLTSGRLPLLEGAGGAATGEAALAHAIRFGIPPFLMPGHEWLNDLEVADLAAFVRRLGGSGPPS